jgi:geranylgeranyl diphosphate synthase, type II
LRQYHLMRMTVNITTYLSEQRRSVEEAMARFMLKAEGPFQAHIEAMRYSLFAGGKRIRPILCLAVGAAIDGSRETRENLLPVACALECIHTYSLIHDDLPAMDNDDLRRGKPTSHVLYGEAGAILAGDGLLTYAFDLLSSDRNSTLAPGRRLQIISIVATAAGSLGMVGGQSLDIASENQEFPFDVLKTIHRSKTGTLITCAVQAGAIGAGAGSEQTKQIVSYGNSIGLAFQIVDDLLNATSTTKQLGKAAGSDAERGKATYPAYFGIDHTKKLAREAVAAAIDSLQGFDTKADPLRALAEYIYTRSN